MNDFLKDLFSATSKKSVAALSEYDDDDLNNFFDAGKEAPKTVLMDLATQVLTNLDNPNLINDVCKRAGLTAKSSEKVVAYVKKNKGELQSIKNTEWIQDEERYGGMSWSVRSVFFSKKEEFKGQKKYALLNIDVIKQDRKDKLILTCSKESVKKIADKLGDLDKEIRSLFGNQQIPE